MKKELKINNYGSAAKPKWSVDEYTDGEYLAQVASYFKSRADAEARAKELASEMGVEYTGCHKRANA